VRVQRIRARLARGRAPLPWESRVAATSALPLSCNCGNIAANTGTFAIAALAGFPSATHAAEI
jgi:hypothetical protein